MKLSATTASSSTRKWKTRKDFQLQEFHGRGGGGLKKNSNVGMYGKKKKLCNATNIHPSMAVQNIS